MTEKNKNKEGKNKEKDKKKKDKINRIKISSSQAEKSGEGMTYDEIQKQEKKDKKIKNLASLAIVLSGLFMGSLFIDVIELITKNGYSERALREAEVFELGDKTWVAYKEPAIQVDVLVVENEADCPNCNADEILVWMKKFIPTMVINEVKETSAEGRNMIEEYNLKTIPAFLFDLNIQESNFFNEEQVKEIFNKKEKKFVLSASSLGVPVGKYLEAPSENKNDIIIGKPDAQVKIVTFFDFQCPYSKLFYNTLKEARGEFSEEQLTLVFKNFPLDLYDQSFNASLVGRCAYQQGKFEPMADLLFEKQEEWSTSGDFKIFNQYSSRIGLDTKKFDECVNSSEMQNLIQKSIDQADVFGINNTPTVFIGKEILTDLFQKSDIVEAISERLE